jgi:hypothetical protein
MAVLKNDRELLEALLRGEKIEKVRHSGFGNFIHLDNDTLVDSEGKPANIYKITPSDLFQTVIDKKENKSE